jgi:threonine synthase
MDPAATLCPRCGDGGEDPGVLDVVYDEDAIARAWRVGRRNGRRDVFRYLPFLPLEEPGSGLMAGGTPLLTTPRLARELGIGTLLLKDETRNPTQCLKDRATAIATALAASGGHRDLSCASPGNAAISLAALCAWQGMRCHAFVPEKLSPNRLAWLERFGADVQVCPGSYDHAYQVAERIGRERGWYSRNCALNPFLVEGKKTAALEIAEQLEGRGPDLVVSPVGDGCTLAALGKGFRQMRHCGGIDRIPRLLGVQAEACSPLVERYRGETSGSPPGGAEPGTDPPAVPTQAVSICVRRPRNALRLLREIEQCGGELVGVSEDTIETAQRRLGHLSGVAVEASTAAALAGLERYAASNPLTDAVVVLILTGGRIDPPG